jgi:hypothetical protein
MAIRNLSGGVGRGSFLSVFDLIIASANARHPQDITILYSIKKYTI